MAHVQKGGSARGDGCDRQEEGFFGSGELDGRSGKRASAMIVREAKRIIPVKARELMIPPEGVHPVASKSFYGMRKKAPERKGLVAPGKASPLRSYRSERLVHKVLLKVPVRGAFRSRKDQWGVKVHSAPIAQPVHI